MSQQTTAGHRIVPFFFEQQIILKFECVFLDVYGNITKMGVTERTYLYLKEKKVQIIENFLFDQMAILNGILESKKEDWKDKLCHKT